MENSWLAYSRDEKLWMQLLGANGNPIGKEVGLGPILDFLSFRKQIMYSPADNLGLLVWESSKAPASNITYIYSRRFQID